MTVKKVVYMQKTHFTARKIILFESLSTQSLITSTKTLYLLHFLMQSADISFFKLVFTFFSFAFELPSGYFSDRYGNRRAVLLSRILIASSMLFYCVLPSFAGFLTANLLLGVADAWESGAKDSYFLKQCLLQKLDYQDLKVRTAKYTYAVNFFLALVSTALFQASIYLPLLLTALFYIAATALLLAMPDDAAQPEQNKLPKNFFFTSKLVLKQILRRRALVLEMLFCTTCTSILISNFDFFSMIFESAGISVSMIGVIYASFGILNIIGVKFYEKTRVSRFSSAVLLLMPFSFLFLVSRSVPLILLGVCFQEVFFSYYNIHLNISVLNSIEDLQNSSYFQSMVSLINVVLRIVLTAVITLAFKVFPFGAVYGGFAAVTLCATCIYLRHTLVKDKS